MTDNNFNELLIHTLKQIHVHLDRLEAKLEEKVDKTDLKSFEQRFDSVEGRLDRVENRLDGVESRLDRIDSGIATLKWVIGVGLAAMGILIALLKVI